jgi:hypothetical protein
VRALVEVSPSKQGYAVEVRLDSAAGKRLALRTMPDPASPADDGIAELLRRVDEDRAQDANKLAPGDVASLGGYLFDLLLGAECWEKIVAEARERGENAIELALKWDSEQLALHRPTWEAMHDGTRFLADNPDHPVAITRVVADAHDIACPEAVASPARVLFLVGAPLNDPSIRGGAEIIGILRGIDDEHASIDSKIVEAVTLEDLGDACADFKPDIVHFVGHGRVRERGELQLSTPEKGESGWANGEQLARAITQGESRPSLVLLTGCESAVAGDHMDSLASELVRRGLPIAIGMSGRISDPVCRLFTRRLGMALAKGEHLVEAMTHGRRAGLQRMRSSAADDRAWAMPSIYLAPCIPERHALVAFKGSSVLDRVARFPIDRRPLFYGRARLGAAFERLLRPQGLGVLVAYTTNGESLGKTRLQQEFARRALMAGHVVVMVDDPDDERSKLPQNSVQLAAALLASIGRTRDAFGLPKLFDSVLLEILERELRPLKLAEERAEMRPGLLERFLDEAEQRTDDGEVLNASLPDALWADLRILLADIREKDADAAERRPILVFGGIGDWGSATQPLFERLIDKTDPGRRPLPFALFATCSWAEENRRLLEDVRNDSDGRTWEEWIELKPFSKKNDEDTLAYQWVLLHPWSGHKFGDIVYAPNPAKGDEWQRTFRRQFDGIPGEFGERAFYAVASVAEENQLLVTADDNGILDSYLER